MEKNFKHMKNKGMNSLFEKITIVDGLGPLQILFIARDPSPSLIHSFLLKEINYLRQSTCSSQIQNQLEK